MSRDSAPVTNGKRTRQRVFSITGSEMACLHRGQNFGNLGALDLSHEEWGRFSQCVNMGHMAFLHNIPEDADISKTRLPVTSFLATM